MNTSKMQFLSEMTTSVVKSWWVRSPRPTDTEPPDEEESEWDVEVKFYYSAKDGAVYAEWRPVGDSFFGPGKESEQFTEGVATIDEDGGFDVVEGYDSDWDEIKEDVEPALKQYYEELLQSAGRKESRMKDWDDEMDMSTGEFWNKRKQNMQEDVEADRAYAQSPQGRLDRAYRKLENLTSFNDGWGTSTMDANTKMMAKKLQAEIDSIQAEMGERKESKMKDCKYCGAEEDLVPIQDYDWDNPNVD